MTCAETTYLFRHVLLRDAARQLQLPGDRGRLHALAFEIFEQLAGGAAPNAAAHPSDAERHYTDSLRLLRAVNSRRFEATTLCGLGLLQLSTGRVAEGRETWRRGIAFVRELGDTHEVESLLNSMRRACAKAGVAAFEK